MPRKKEKAALGKPAQFGPDLDLSAYTREAKAVAPCPIGKLPKDMLKRAAQVGIGPEKDRAGTYFQVNHSTVFQNVRDALRGKVEIMSTKDAMEKYGWLRDYWWKTVAATADKYTALAEEKWDRGYFMRILPNQQVVLPLQACLFISQENLDQNVHNVIIAEPGSQAQIITGCTVHPNVGRGLHVGISEFYIKKNAKLTFTMIHNWAEGVDVRPRTGAFVEDGATFISNYVCMAPVKSLQMYPAAYCNGSDSRARFNALLYGSKDSLLDVGSRVVLSGKNSRGEVLSRVIATDNSKVYARGRLVGEHKESRAHLECRGLLLSDTALIHSIPELIGKVEGTELSHEAAVGKISEEEVEYLMARGFSEDEATALIVRGFMDIEIFGLPDALKGEIKHIVETTTKKAL